MCTGAPAGLLMTESEMTGAVHLSQSTSAFVASRANDFDGAVGTASKHEGFATGRFG